MSVVALPRLTNPPGPWSLALIVKSMNGSNGAELYSWLRNVWFPAARVTVPADIAGSARLTRALLLDVARRARTALFLVPSPGPDRPLEAHSEAQLLHQLFDGSGLRWALVDLDESERWDGHPNARGARKLAAAVESALRESIASVR